MSTGCTEICYFLNDRSIPYSKSIPVPRKSIRLEDLRTFIGEDLVFFKREDHRGNVWINRHQQAYSKKELNSDEELRKYLEWAEEQNRFKQLYPLHAETREFYYNGNPALPLKEAQFGVHQSINSQGVSWQGQVPMQGMNRLGQGQMLSSGQQSMNASPQQQIQSDQSAAADYSAQWAQYYRSIGMVKEAEVFEVQARMKLKERDNLKNSEIISVKDLTAKMVGLLEDMNTLKADSKALKVDNAALKADSKVLKADNAVLKTDNAALKTDNAALKADNEKIKETMGRLEKLEWMLKPTNAHHNNVTQKTQKEPGEVRSE